jgi:hypothetical protein
VQISHVGHEMNGPTLTMAPAVEPMGSFHRSHSSPNLLSLSSTLTKPAPSLSSSNHQRGLSLKSLPSLPAFDVPSFDPDPAFDTTLFLDGKGSSGPSKKTKSSTDVRAEPVQAPPPKTQKISRRSSIIDRPRSWLPSSKSATNIRELVSERRPSTAVDCDAFGGQKTSTPEPEVERPRTVSDSFANYARRSWMSTSRSPSPQRKQEDTPAVLGRDRAASNGSGKAAKSTRKRPVSTLDAETNRSTESLSGTTRAFNRASTYLTKIKQRPQSVLVKLGSSNDSDDSCASSATSLAPPTTTTTETHPSQSASLAESNSTTDESSSDMVSFKIKRDPLFSQFKDLDNEFAKFSSKTTSQRVSIVRNSLLMFLRTYKMPSAHTNTSISPEDVDRRATVLNKWWIGLLDMLDGRGQQPLAGVDRPALLEAATMIMTRPEWRMTTSYLMPLADRSPAERVRARSWTQSTTGSSMNSSEAAFLAESAAHNVRTMFVANLTTQMSLVVDKISLRHAPLSLVNWAGKACAYAFFFAPGVAEQLVRLWNLGPAIVQRVADELGLPRKSNGESEDIVALFPPCLSALGWSSVKTATDRLREPAKLPVAAMSILWYEKTWMQRWFGRDTDLFFIFCKYFHILADEFMPSDLPLIEKARAPAFVLVHAQLLHTLDTTIHRQAAVEALLGPPISDALHGADAAMSMTIPSNLLKGMSENRLIILLKDVLEVSVPDIVAARRTFGESFMCMMKAAARKTSMFDHNACFTLCDFLEEALVVYDVHEDPERPDFEYVDWPFWFEACKRIMDSLNTMSEIRMLAFIFSIWEVVASSPQRKEAICLDWLLTEETFDKYFNHWCPMVRAYYQRLLCWRICRDGGSANEVDA